MVPGEESGFRPHSAAVPPQDPAPVLSSPPPADVSTFLAFPSPEKLLRLGPKSSVLIAQQVSELGTSWRGTAGRGCRAP